MSVCKVGLLRAHFPSSPRLCWIFQKDGRLQVVQAVGLDRFGQKSDRWEVDIRPSAAVYHGPSLLGSCQRP